MPKRVVRYWKKTPTWFRNKYSITLLVFFAYMLFFDQSNVVALLQINQELRELEDNKEYYKEQIETTQKDLTDLLTNNNNLERYAREKYLMKKENEDIFVIVDPIKK